MVPVLTAAARDGEHHLVTEDESWFFLSYSPRRMWTLGRDDVATKPRYDVHTKKFMRTLIWNPLGFHVLDKLPIGGKMDSDYFTTNILESLEQKVILTGRNPHVKWLTIQVDNGSIHMARTIEEYIRQQNMTRLQHPPYSPDFASSNFYLFLTIKEKPKDIQMADEEDLFYRLEDILNRISRKELDEVFGTWINRLMIVSYSPLYHEAYIFPRGSHILTMIFGWRKGLPTIRYLNSVDLLNMNNHIIHVRGLLMSFH
jgi:hypothetical protein